MVRAEQGHSGQQRNYRQWNAYTHQNYVRRSAPLRLRGTDGAGGAQARDGGAQFLTLAGWLLR